MLQTSTLYLHTDNLRRIRTISNSGWTSRLPGRCARRQCRTVMNGLSDLWIDGFVAGPVKSLACSAFENRRLKFAGHLAAPCLIVILSLAAHCIADAKPSADTNAVWLAEHYTKYEHRIPMRDGVRLFTRVYVPKDYSRAWPI